MSLGDNGPDTTVRLGANLICRVCTEAGRGVSVKAYGPTPPSPPPAFRHYDWLVVIQNGSQTALNHEYILGYE